MRPPLSCKRTRKTVSGGPGSTHPPTCARLQRARTPWLPRYTEPLHKCLSPRHCLARRASTWVQLPVPQAISSTSSPASTSPTHLTIGLRTLPQVHCPYGSYTRHARVRELHSTPASPEPKLVDRALAWPQDSSEPQPHRPALSRLRCGGTWRVARGAVQSALVAQSIPKPGTGPALRRGDHTAWLVTDPQESVDPTVALGSSLSGHRRRQPVDPYTHTH